MDKVVTAMVSITPPITQIVSFNAVENTLVEDTMLILFISYRIVRFSC